MTDSSLPPIISRAEARAAGLPRYFGGRPCSKGHLCERYTLTKQCVECERIRARKRYADDPKTWNRRAFDWRARNYDAFSAQRKAWQQNNMAKVALIRRNRRARVAGAEGRHTLADVERIYAEQEGRCACCGEGAATGWHVDHVMPLALGGSNGPDNLQILCAACNYLKNAKHPAEFCRDYYRRVGVWPLFAAAWGWHD